MRWSIPSLCYCNAGRMLGFLTEAGGRVYPNTPGDHAPANLRAFFLQSLKALGRERVRTFYLHAPDRSVPFEETVAEVNRLHNEGRFEIFGLSNFASWEVAEIVTICRANGWVPPRVYQV